LAGLLNALRSQEAYLAMPGAGVRISLKTLVFDNQSLFYLGFAGALFFAYGNGDYLHLDPGIQL
jgi:hypothetical protein